jgi:hypothetical protein
MREAEADVWKCCECLPMNFVCDCERLRAEDEKRPLSSEDSTTAMVSDVAVIVGGIEVSNRTSVSKVLSRLPNQALLHDCAR